jgi:uracil-DNA glycosylase family 4
MNASPKELEERKERMREIRDEVLNLKESPLYEERVKNNYFPVIGQGSHTADIMFIGEAPGKNEAKTSVPFCGAAGRILDSLLESIGLPRASVYITNIVKDRPPGNRDPLPNEIEIYAPFLDRQIEIIRPKVIATLGRFSMAYVMNKLGLSTELDTIARLHGKTFEAKTSYGTVRVLPLYHPAAAIYNQHLRSTLEKDFQELKKFLSHES